MVLLLTAAAAIGAAAPACGGGGASSTGGSGGAASGGAGGASAAPWRPCPAATRVGGVSLALIAAAENAPAYAQILGSVKNGVRPSDVWRELAQEGACRLIVGPQLDCATSCDAGKVCAGDNACIDEPISQSAGTITITGLAEAASFPPLGNKTYYFAFSDGAPYPPYAVGAAIALAAAGADHPAFSAAGRGIDPLVFPAQALDVARGQPLAVTWTAPAAAGAGTIGLRLDIAHHGGIAARVECDLPDTGAATVPAALISQLIDRGTAGFPTVSLTRRSVDSATIPAGCVEFSIASSIERPVNVEGVISCGEELPCPGNRECRPDLTCAP